jgi:hypothetical protein
LLLGATSASSSTRLFHGFPPFIYGELIVLMAEKKILPFFIFIISLCFFLHIHFPSAQFHH